MDRLEASLTDDGRYRLLVEAVTDYAIYMLNADGVVTSWNPGAQRFKGYQAAEIIGQHFSVFYEPEDRRVGLPETALRIAAREGRFENEGWRVRKDGTRFWANVVIDPIRTPEGEVVGYAKITRDLTERRAAEEALRRSEEQFRLLVQGVSDYSIYMLDPQGLVTNWNLGAQRIKGYLAEEIIGEHFSRFYAEEDRAAGLPAAALETAAREGRFEREGWRVRKDGTKFYANVVIDAIVDRGRLIGFAKITRDITEQLETQHALEEAREALFQSQKMEAIGQLTGGLAHDFNNLLTSILGGLQLIEKRLAQGQVTQLERYVDVAMASAKRAAALTHRLLAFSRRQTLDPKPTDVNWLVAGIDELIRRTVGPVIAVETATASDVWGTLVDPNQLENALLNLCINARDAQPDGGRIIIETANRWLDDRRAAEHDLPPGQYVTLCVSDHGAGMSPETVARAFDPFFTTKPLGEGTGLGLSMVYGFVRQSGGQARIHSVLGQGTTVCLYLPRHMGGAEAAAAAGDELAVRAEAQEGESVLIVDDEPAVRMLVAETLADLGYRIAEAADGREGLSILNSSRRIDLLISDVGLPGGINGRQLADAARALRPALKVLFITGYAENAVIGNDQLQPGMHVLTKPFVLDELTQRVQKILAGA